MTLPLAAAVTVLPAGQASASCVANPFAGTWRSSDDRLSRIDLWQGDDCGLRARPYSTCERDRTRDCAWDVKRVEGPGGNFRFVNYRWNNATEVLQMRLQNRTHMSVWDHTEYTSGRDVTFTVVMNKD
ncbi:hypothetical protein [Streptomyces sp. WAC06614]|uniref:hypothetical protein n=1 Tax=Streptomyces sp. WAC06614 TaxID=2487416 RepID=UPI000F79BA5E|nr:hypothetical protein [Streptomyces sp. WAC06614]